VDFLDGAFAQHLVHYGYGAIFLIVMMESAGIPMPGETILVSAAVYAGTRHTLDIRYVIAAAAGGAIVGDNIGFWVGREFGEPLDRHRSFVGTDTPFVFRRQPVLADNQVRICCNLRKHFHESE